MGEGAVTSEVLSPAPARSETLTVTGQMRFEERMAAPFILKSLSAETRESYRRGIQEFFRHAGWLHPAQVTTEHVLGSYSPPHVSGQWKTPRDGPHTRGPWLQTNRRS
jgi:hypothetical protein